MYHFPLCHFYYHMYCLFWLATYAFRLYQDSTGPLQQRTTQTDRTRKKASSYVSLAVASRHLDDPLLELAPWLLRKSNRDKQAKTEKHWKNERNEDRKNESLTARVVLSIEPSKNKKKQQRPTHAYTRQKSPNGTSNWSFAPPLPPPAADHWRPVARSGTRTITPDKERYLKGK